MAHRYSLWLVLTTLFFLPRVVRAEGAAAGVYVRTDSNDTLVVSPRGEANVQLDETNLSATYAVDIWTSASIDILVSASRQVDAQGNSSVKPVTEQRDEVDLAVAHELEDITLTGSYRYSIENDYQSHGGTAGLSWDFASNNSTLALNTNVFQDAVGQSGNSQFSRSLSTLGARTTFTQILDVDSLVQFTYELGHLSGYMASPYRVVGIGGTGYGCQNAVQCLPEHVPETRLRHAAAALYRRALGEDFSAGVNYRFYTDDWGLLSNTIALHASYLPDEFTLITLRYRFYLQSAVDFYKPIYLTLPTANDYTTRDRELSAMQDHRIGLDLQRKVPFEGNDTAIILSAGFGLDLYSYNNFVGLDQVQALELSIGVGVEQ